MKTMRRFIGSTNSSVPARQRLTLGVDLWCAVVDGHGHPAGNGQRRSQ